MKFHCGISRHQLKSPFLILVAVMVVCHQSCLFRLSVPVDFPRIIFKTCCCTSLGLFILCLLTNMYILRCISIFEHDKYIDSKFWTGYFEFQVIKRTNSCRSSNRYERRFHWQILSRLRVYLKCHSHVECAPCFKC